MEYYEKPYRGIWNNLEINWGRIRSYLPNIGQHKANKQQNKSIKKLHEPVPHGKIYRVALSQI